MALYGLSLHNIQRGRWFIWPQGFLLLMQGLFCFYFASIGRYADGTVISPAHIRVDQMPFMLCVSLFHTLALVDLTGAKFITRFFNFLCLRIQINRGL